MGEVDSNEYFDEWGDFGKVDVLSWLMAMLLQRDFTERESGKQQGTFFGSGEIDAKQFRQGYYRGGR